MEQAALKLGAIAPIESIRGRSGQSMPLAIDVSDPEVIVELRRFPEGIERERYALAALRVGVLALRVANGQIDAATIREAGQSVISEVRELLSSRGAELYERFGAVLNQYLDAQRGALPQRLDALTRSDGDIDRLLRAHVSGDDSMLARSLAKHVGESSPLLKLLSPTDANGLRAQLVSTFEAALTEQREQFLREFSLDYKDSALSRLVGQFSLDDDGSAMARLSRLVTSATEQIGKNLTLDDDTSALSRLKRELQATIDRLVRENVEFQAQVREALARLDSRKKVEARTPRHGIDFEEQLGASLAFEAERSGDLFEATGETTGLIKNCKVGDYVVSLGADSAAANARVVWEAKDKRGVTLRAALDEIDEARRNRQAQVGVFVFARENAPDSLGVLQRYGNDVIVVWDPDEPSTELVLRAAYSLTRALVVRERRAGESSHAAVAEIERSARAIEKQIGFLDDVRKWAETVKGHGEKIADRSARMAAELQRDVDRLDAQIGALRTAEP